ncbi:MULTISPECIES: VolA/Pla-1 family phospholipase [unclassified Agarivorans]|nr:MULTISPECIES: VolA/Pla-1 family phospholipase [unclassified Agarivorans]MDO6685035.1 alpha/beta fold hydrolase [Agarivorans sp. 3_MG-2023]MDO6717407.1 alpha/beta fold hydrolase [Agarivorans sp. 2_MG-2023]
MRLSRIATAVTLFTSVTLAGCGSSNSPFDFSNDITPNEPNSVKIRFNPLIGDVSTPNNLLFNGSQDGTVNLPSEAAIVATQEYQSITNVLGALDGWQTSVPFSIPLGYGDDEGEYNAEIDTTLDESTFAAGVLLYKVRASGFVDTCADVTENGGSFSAGQTCRIDEQLVYGEDYLATFSDGNIVVTPLKPFTTATSYMVAITESLLDSNGRPVEAGSGYQLLSTAATAEDDATTQQLKGLTGFNNGLLAAEGVTEAVSYAAVFTTQSVGSVLSALQQVYGGMALNGLLPLGALVDTGSTAEDVANTVLGASQPSFAAAKYFKSTLSVPYYLSDLDNPDITGADMNKWAQARTDSPVAILQLLQTNADFADQASGTSFWTQAFARGFDTSAFGVLVAGGDTATAGTMLAQADLAGLTYVEDGETKAVDAHRHLTAYNPIPETRSTALLNLDIYFPDETLTGQTMPADGWPVVVFQHGIGSLKETAAGIAASYAAQGYAVLAMDLPYHGTRGIDLTGDGNADLSANADAQVFANLGSFLSIRENLRQSSADLLALRAALQAATAPAELDGSKVHFVGQSLGSIVGVGAAALAGEVIVSGFPIDYSLQSASLSVPGGGLAGIFQNSPSFAPLVEANLKANPGYLGLVAAGLGFEDNDSATALEQFAVYQATYPEAAQLVIDSNYAAFAQVFGALGQTVVDGADPLNYAQAGFSMPVLVHEVVGDGSEGSGDQVIPNSLPTLPLVGTEPLIAAMGLEGAAVTSAGSYAIRFGQGSHSSLISPTVSLATTVEMQSQFVGYAVSADAGNATVVVNDSSVISTAQ